MQSMQCKKICNAICAMQSNYEKQVMLKRSATADEVADTVMWYVKSPHLITGENIFVDGGLHLSS